MKDPLLRCGPTPSRLAVLSAVCLGGGIPGCFSIPVDPSPEEYYEANAGNEQALARLGFYPLQRRVVVGFYPGALHASYWSDEYEPTSYKYDEFDGPVETVLKATLVNVALLIPTVVSWLVEWDAGYWEGQSEHLGHLAVLGYYKSGGPPCPQGAQKALEPFRSEAARRLAADEDFLLVARDLASRADVEVGPAILWLWPAREEARKARMGPPTPQVAASPAARVETVGGAPGEGSGGPGEMGDPGAGAPEWVSRGADAFPQEAGRALFGRGLASLPASARGEEAVAQAVNAASEEALLDALEDVWRLVRGVVDAYEETVLAKPIPAGDRSAILEACGRSTALLLVGDASGTGRSVDPDVVKRAVHIDEKAGKCHVLVLVDCAPSGARESLPRELFEALHRDLEPARKSCGLKVDAASASEALRREIIPLGAKAIGLTSWVLPPSDPRGGHGGPETMGGVDLDSLLREGHEASMEGAGDAREAGEAGDPGGSSEDGGSP